MARVWENGVERFFSTARYQVGQTYQEVRRSWRTFLNATDANWIVADYPIRRRLSPMEREYVSHQVASQLAQLKQDRALEKGSERGQSHVLTKWKKRYLYHKAGDLRIIRVGEDIHTERVQQHISALVLPGAVERTQEALRGAMSKVRSRYPTSSYYRSKTGIYPEN